MDNSDGEEARVIPINDEDDDLEGEGLPKLPENPELTRAMEEALASVEKIEKKDQPDEGEKWQQERESLQKRIKNLHMEMMEKDKELETRNEEMEKLKDLAARRQADLENYKKRTLKDKADQFNYGNEEIAKEFLGVLDNLNRALAYIDSDPKALVEGVELTKKFMEQAFAKFGVEPVNAVGKKFDPNVHDALAQRYSPDHEPGTVIEESQRGYMLKNRLLRPSSVVVAAQPPTDQNESKENDPES